MIGANDEDLEGTFVWVDNSNFGYTNWYSGEPNNWTNWAGGENCVTVRDEGKWHDSKCHVPLPFLCKYTDPPIGVVSVTDYLAEEAARIAAEEAAEAARIANEEAARIRVEECQNLEPDAALYSFHKTGKSFHKASNDCEKNGGTLASVHCARENEFLTDAFGGTEFWIGGTNKANWVWEDGTSFSYTNWNFGEPNNWMKNERNIAVKSNGMWNDVNQA